MGSTITMAARMIVFMHGGLTHYYLEIAILQEVGFHLPAC
jgi:hypothetical protein